MTKESAGGIKAAVFTPDRSSVVLGLSDGRLQLYPLDKKTAPVTIAKDGRAVDKLAISADGRTLVASKGATVELYSLPELRRLTEIATGYSGKRHVAISPRRQFVAVTRERAYGAQKGKIIFWQLPDAGPSGEAQDTGCRSRPTLQFHYHRQETADRFPFGELHQCECARVFAIRAISCFRRKATSPKTLAPLSKISE